MISLTGRQISNYLGKYRGSVKFMESLYNGILSLNLEKLKNLYSVNIDRIKNNDPDNTKYMLIFQLTILTDILIESGIIEKSDYPEFETIIKQIKKSKLFDSITHNQTIEKISLDVVYSEIEKNKQIEQKKPDEKKVKVNKKFTEKNNNDYYMECAGSQKKIEKVNNNGYVSKYKIDKNSYYYQYYKD